jgi:hypothetical protein
MRVLAALACAFAALAAQAGVVYRWVDDQGRTHVSDVVPEKYRDRATRIDTGAFEVSPERTKEAQERAARDKARADEAAKARERAAAAERVPAASAAAAAARAASAPKDVPPGADCATRLRLYRESQECFARYRTVHGGLKAEAFQNCAEVPDPVPDCGPVRTP